MKKVFLALDGISKEEIYSLLERNVQEITNIKIGLELYCKYGNDFILDLKSKYKLNIFLDLKLYDIPNTIQSAIKSLAPLNIEFLTLHMSGGEEMLKKAIIARDMYCPETKILGVSILTSFSNEECKNIYNTSLDISLNNFSTMLSKCKLDGVICSAADLENFKNNNCLKVCPGIRFESDSKDDQKRVFTPKKALALGADYLVMGRSLIKNQAKIKDQSLWTQVYSSQ